MVTSMCSTAKSNFYTNKILENKGNKKELFNVANGLMHRNKTKPLPTHIDPKELADDFADYFSTKISKIREAFPPSDLQPHLEDKCDAPLFDTLQPTCEAELKKLIMAFNSKSCALDPIPTTLLKECIDCLLPVLKSK